MDALVSNISISQQAQLAARKWLSLGGPVPENEFQAFLAVARERHFKQGEAIVRAGEVCSSLYLIVEGLARYHYLTPEGKEFNKSFAISGMVAASLVSLKLGEPSPFSIEAQEETWALEVPNNFLREAYDRHAFWSRFGREMFELLALRKERREASLLTLSAEERYDEFLGLYPDLIDRVPLYHIASYLGITPVALSRIRARQRAE